MHTLVFLEVCERKGNHDSDRREQDDAQVRSYVYRKPWVILQQEIDDEAEAIDDRHKQHVAHDHDQHQVRVTTGPYGDLHGYILLLPEKFPIRQIRFYVARGAY